MNSNKSKYLATILTGAVILILHPEPNYGLASSSASSILNSLENLVEIVEIKTDQNKETHRCSGSIINKKWILTSAQCRFTSDENKWDYFRVYVANHDIQINKETEQKKHVVNVINHPNYNSSTSENDIAVWEISTPFEFNEIIQPVILPDADFIPKGSARVGSWITFGGGTKSIIFLNMWIPIVSNEKCSRIFRFSISGNAITSTMLCAGEKNLCEVDGGGPLMCPDKGDILVQCGIGIASFEFSCDGVLTYPGVFTRISKYLNWIRKEASLLPHCGEHYTAPSGEIFIYQYPKYLYCKWSISSQNPKNQILITFAEKFDLEQNDYLKAIDNEGYIELFKLTGNKTGIKSFTSLGNSLNLIFESHENSGFGFKLFYEFITAKCRETLRSKTGQIQHLIRNKNETCEWILMPDDLKDLGQLEIKFDASFKLFGYDFFKVLDLKTKKVVLACTEFVPPKDTILKGHPHQIILTSDPYSRNDGRGFTLFYKFGDDINIDVNKYLPVSLGLSIPLLFFLILFIVVCRKYKQVNVNMRNLSDYEIDKFFRGTSDGSDEIVDVNRAYNMKQEIAIENIEIDNKAILGSGNFGLVLKGKYLNEEVAIKTTKPNADLEYFNALLSELKIMGQIGDNENLIGYIGACTKNIKERKVYLVVEICTLGNLENYLRANSEFFSNLLIDKNIRENRENIDNFQMSTFDLALWSQQIANGMEYISSKNVIDGDLATRNVLLFQKNHVKITDFGLSRNLYNYKVYAKTQKQALPWPWLAYESLKFMNFSIESDVWAYGVTIWEIFSLGQIPHIEHSFTQEFITLTGNGLRLQKPQHANAEIYEQIGKCWSKEPKNRPKFAELKTFFNKIMSDAREAVYSVLEEKFE